MRAKSLATQFDEKNGGIQGHTLFNDNTISKWRDDLLFDNVTNIYDLSGVTEANSFLPVMFMNKLKVNTKKNSLYGFFNNYTRQNKQ